MDGLVPVQVLLAAAIRREQGETLSGGSPEAVRKHHRTHSLPAALAGGGKRCPLFSCGSLGGNFAWLGTECEPAIPPGTDQSTHRSKDSRSPYLALTSTLRGATFRLEVDAMKLLIRRRGLG